MFIPLKFETTLDCGEIQNVLCALIPQDDMPEDGGCCGILCSACVLSSLDNTETFKVYLQHGGFTEE